MSDADGDVRDAARMLLDEGQEPATVREKNEKGGERARVEPAGRRRTR
jgi:hypothetical protein